ncbi:hypothetical protein GWI33_009216 [Rhynchophorus ferrugineus]|uniref:Cytochrome P450 n=1 Tax=Rhynchophorus ferrugineus TaxID=354439 RepID=A0A834MBP8_RHYFE|nr:hypothetical protein GWI33_009216 [Rhynchophorus ferrugineus]
MELSVLDVLLFIVATIITIWFYFQNSYRYWDKRQVPYLKPVFPYGNSTTLLQKDSLPAGEVYNWYNELKNKGHQFGGVWSFSRPVFVVLDPEYIKDILTKDFHHFVNREIYCNEKHDPLGTNLFNIEEQSWKLLRQKLTPTFTSGKMKMMFKSIVDCSDNMIKFLEKKSDADEDIDIREVLASFTSDVIGNVAFGVESNSFDDSKNDIRKYGKEIFETFDLLLLLRIAAQRICPNISKKLGIKSMPDRMIEFFSNLVKTTMEYRTKNNITRPDFLQLLIDMHQEGETSEKYVNFDQIVANTLLFFIAGFDTSSTTMTFTLYELARCPDIQEKTRQEIQKVLSKHENKLTYEALQEMTYLQQVVDEAMRIWPPLITLGRICTRDYRLRDSDIVIEKGTPVVISTLGLGRDPRYYADPEKFDPERFSSEEKNKRHPYIHIPFGEGPRNCIGLRFGLMQSKIGIIRILTNFRIHISTKTKMPLTVDPSIFLLKSNETLYLKAEKM